MSSWDKLKIVLSKVWNMIPSRKVQIEVQILDTRRNRIRILKKKDLPKIQVKGRVLDQSKRTVLDLKSSLAVTHPEGWLTPIQNGRHVKTMDVLLEGSDETCILITNLKSFPEVTVD